jgi:hypothetical protein
MWRASSIDGVRTFPDEQRRLASPLRHLRRRGREQLAFLIYGSRFAKLLELPERPTRGIPITRQLPGRYLTLFTEGCRHAIAQGAPVRLSGVVVDYGQIELYRAAFMPLAMQLTSSKQLVFGTFNRRIGPKASSSDAIRTTYNWLFENIQADRGPRPS